METDQIPMIVLGPLNPAVCKIQSWILQFLEPISKVGFGIVIRIKGKLEVRNVVRVRASVRFGVNIKVMIRCRIRG